MFNAVNAKYSLLMATLIMAACSGSGSNSGDTVGMGESNGPANDPVENTGTGDSTADAGESGGVDAGDVAADQGTLNPGNTNAILLQAFEIYSGRAYDHRLVAFPYEQRSSVTDYFTSYISRDCQNDGVVTREQTFEDLIFDSTSFYDNCNIDGDILNGESSFIQERYEGKYRREFQNDFSVSFAPGGLMELQGVYEYEPSIGYIRSFTVNEFNYHFSYNGGTLTVRDAKTNRVYGTTGFTEVDNLTSYMTGSFTMFPPILDGRSVAVSIVENFSNSNDTLTQLAYERGQMEIVADDSTIVLDANTGDLQTVEVTVTQASGDSQTTTENWSRWYQALAYIPPELAEKERKPATTGTGSTINESNYRQILEEVLGVMTGDTFGAELLELPDYPFPDFPDDLYDPSYPDGLRDSFTLSCDNGGSVVLAPYKYGARQITTGWNADFSECNRAGQTTNGKYSTRYFGNYSNSSSGIVIESESERTEFAGSFYYKLRANRDGSPQRQYSLFVDVLDIQSAGVSESLRSANLLYSHALPYNSTMSGYFYLNSGQTNGATLHVSTADPLRFDQVGSDFLDPLLFNKFQTGVMVIDAGNNNSLRLNAGTGNVETFTLTLLRQNSEPITFTEQWDDWIDVLEFNFDLEER